MTQIKTIHRTLLVTAFVSSTVLSYLLRKNLRYVYFHCHWLHWSLPYILAYKPTIFGTILTFKLWGSAYTRVMPHSQSRQSARRLSVNDAYCV